jgi:exosortase/archaeosortase family protein
MKRELKKYKSHFLKNVFYFFVLLLSFHFIYLFWTQQHFYPIEKQVNVLFDKASKLLFDQSTWMLRDVLQIKITTEGQTIFVNGHKAYVEVSPGCTSLKQWLHWLFLMLLFPGSWKHKLWYIPFGVIIIHFINVFRVIGLTLVIIPWSQYFHFFHDSFFRPIFYLFIFIMWVIWMEFFVHLKKRKAIQLT